MFTLIEITIIVSSFQGTSSSYTLDTKSDTVAKTSDSISFTQRISGGIQAVAQYITNLFSGRFGILDEEDNTNITGCMNLTISGRTYYLNNDVMSNSTCFYVKANGVTLNCQGYKITYANKTTGYAITSDKYNNTLIKNCLIEQGNKSRTSCYSIYFRRGNNLTTINNTINTYGSTITTSNNFGIYVNSMSNNLIKENNITTTGQYSYNIYIFNSSNTNITQNNLTSNGRYGHNIVISQQKSELNSITDNEIKSFNNNTQGININAYSSSNEIINNNINTKGSSSFGMYLSSNITYLKIYLNNLTIDGINSYGVYITVNSKNNNITNNKITSLNTGSRGIYTTSNSNKNQIINNSINSYSYALVISNSNESLVYNNIFNTTVSRIYSISNLTNWLNTTKTPTTNIINGNYLGGNYWSNSINTGFSQTCPDSDNDGICDKNLTSNSYKYNDFLALTTTDNTAPNITIYSPINGSYVNGRVTIKVNAKDDRIIKNIQFQYSNSTVSWTNLSGCNGTKKYCYWYSNSFTQNSDYFIKAIAYDAANNSGYDIVKYTIDRSKPIIYYLEVTYPKDQNSVKDNQNITLNASVTDAPEIASGIKFSTAYIKSLNQTDWTNMTLIEGNTHPLENSTWAVINLTINSLNYSGIKYANISVYDNATPSNIRTGDLWEVQIDNQVPTYDSLNSTNYLYNNSEANFYINCQDNFNLSHYIFSTNYSGDWINSSSIELEGTSYYITHTTIVYTGNFSYKFYIFDDAGNMNETLTEDIEILGEPPEPTIYLVYPEDNSIIMNTTSVDLSYYYIASNMSNCSLYINGNLSEFNTAPLQNVIDTFSKTLINGNYSWFVSCNQIETIDEENISVDYFSNSRSFEIRSCTGIWIIYGDWSECSSGIQSRIKTDTGGCIDIENQSCGGSGGGGGGGGGCTPNCNNKECGDNSCSGNCGNCNIGYECKDFKCEKICSSIWDCTEWSNCSFGKEKRKCNDLNNCNQTLGKPEELRVCGCIEDWYCKWSSCNEKGYQNAEYCEDLNNCGTIVNKPNERICKCEPAYQCDKWSNCVVNYNIQDIIKGKPTLSGFQSRICIDVNHCENKSIKTGNCSLQSKIKIKTVELCNDMYIELYDTEQKIVVSRIREYSTNDNRKVDIRLSASQNLSNYCDYCSDKIKNYDEEKIDCGGPNCPPCINKGNYFDWLFWLKLILWITFLILTIKYKFEKRKIEPKNKLNLSV